MKYKTKDRVVFGPPALPVSTKRGNLMCNPIDIDTHSGYYSYTRKQLKIYEIEVMPILFMRGKARPKRGGN